MRNPRPEAFDSKARERKPDSIDMNGIVPIGRPQPKQVVFPTPRQPEPISKPGVVSRYHETRSASPLSSPPHVIPTQVAQMVRKAVKEFGKEAATYRFTAAEKKALAEIIYDYRRQGLRTNENEITRVAINYMFHDYQWHKQQSLLYQLLAALNE